MVKDCWKAKFLIGKAVLKFFTTIIFFAGQMSAHMEWRNRQK